jgi:energy-coupling factor transporter transmembrane protein EcfT
MHFQAYGLTIGIIIIIYAFVINKLRLRACVLLSSLFVPFIVLITFSTRDAVSTNSYALTNEGYPISGISCGTYMYDHHKMGLFGSWIYTIGFVGPFVVWILCVLIYLLVYGVLYLLSCKSVCPEINQSVEENC